MPPPSYSRGGWRDLRSALSRVRRLARDRKVKGGEQRSEEERERARQERERRRLERAGAPSPAQLEPPLPPPNEPPGFESTQAEGANVEPIPAESSAFEPTPVEPTPVEPTPVEPTPAESSAFEPLPDDPFSFQGGQGEPTSVEPPEASPVTVAQQPEVVDSAPGPRASIQFPPDDEPAIVAPARSASHLRRPQPRGPHLHRPHVSRPRGVAVRMGALLALVLVLGGLAVAGAILLRHKTTPKSLPAPAVVRLTIPEGFTRSQIAALAHSAGLKGSYLVASKRSPQLNLARYGAPAATPDLEGFLFPATYELYAGTPASRLVSEQLAAFRENFGGGEVHRAKVLGVTPYELLIVASIIEREVAIPHDRPLVAAVIYNRLRLHMTLGVDSTLRYALHDFSHPLTESQLASDSPYNTRTHQGLPPTPISNPGLAAITAAAHPAKVSYLYYVSGADGCGEQVFSTSYAQFEHNAAAYREALQKNGGRVPTCHKK